MSLCVPGTDVNEQILRGNDHDLEFETIGFSRIEVLRLAVKNAEGAVIGGLNTDLNTKWLKINMVILDEDSRRCGVGTKLLGTAEKFSADAGARGIWFDTFDWQALKFYKDRGYQQFAHIENCIASYGLISFRRECKVKQQIHDRGVLIEYFLDSWGLRFCG